MNIVGAVGIILHAVEVRLLYRLGRGAQRWAIRRRCDLRDFYQLGLRSRTVGLPAVARHVEIDEPGVEEYVADHGQHEYTSEPTITTSASYRWAINILV